MSDIQRIIDSIPETEFLGVMATDIEVYSDYECLVCRLISPERPCIPRGGTLPPEPVARKLGLPEDDMWSLYYDAAYSTAEVEEAIADRLNRLVSV